MLVKCVAVCGVPSWVYGCFENTAPQGGFPVLALQAAPPGLGVGPGTVWHLLTDMLSPATAPATSPGRTCPPVGSQAVF